MEKKDYFYEKLKNKEKYFLKRSPTYLNTGRGLKILGNSREKI